MHHAVSQLNPTKPTGNLMFDVKTLYFAHTVHYVLLLCVTLTINSDIPLYITSWLAFRMEAHCVSVVYELILYVLVCTLILFAKG